ncbi:MAG: adenylate/guanylate cyclase domain-containing protein [Ignavibacteria bacterium]
MISGNIGSESLKRLDYTVIGDIVNTAQRPQQVAEPGKIFIISCFERSKTFDCRKVGEVKLKNKDNAVNVYEAIE